MRCAKTCFDLLLCARVGVHELDLEQISVYADLSSKIAQKYWSKCKNDPQNRLFIFTRFFGQLRVN